MSSVQTTSCLQRQIELLSCLNYADTWILVIAENFIRYFARCSKLWRECVLTRRSVETRFDEFPDRNNFSSIRYTMLTLLSYFILTCLLGKCLLRLIQSVRTIFFFLYFERLSSVSLNEILSVYRTGMRSMTITTTSTYLRVRTQGTRVSWVAKHTGLGKAKARE